MHDEHEDQMMDSLETRLSAAVGVKRAVSPMPNAVAARVRRCGRARRARFAALAIVPIALAVGVMSFEFSQPGEPSPVIGNPETFAAGLFVEGDFPGLIGRREMESLFLDSRPPTVVRASYEHVFSLRDGHDPAMIESLFSGS
jgi:hypothetical protein